MQEASQDINVNGKIIQANQIGHLASATRPNAKLTVLMRLHFLVHTFINMYVLDHESGQPKVGYKMTERNAATKQTHLLTLDKIVCTMPV